ncbi:hypothetical protein EZS27_018128 [termite gut metagenome]|jgi:hypothetical protein|uniref:Uncharacterized protein n=1 Tax=termite gut metagenome TaxID=433724 RepID=A0A5J4RJV0_9ZZZZ
MSNEEFELSISSQLKRQYRLNIESSCFSTGYIPKHILLDRTRNIHSYLLFCRNDNHSIIGSYWERGKLQNELLNILRTQFSKLDRPLFFIIQDTDKTLKIIEGNFIREQMLQTPNSSIEEILLTQSNILQDIIFSIKNEL